MKAKGLSGLPSGEIDTLLFDLDGTLIEMRRKAEIIFYLKAFRRFRDYFNPLTFYISFWKSVRHVRTNTSESLNYDVFVGKMAQFGRTTPQMIDALVTDLVEKDFRSLGPFFTPVPGAREAVLHARKLGYRLALVTNPVVPRKSVLYRIEWAGLHPADFLFITSSQNMNRCKPDTQFYERLLRRLELKPEQCLMIGNSSAEDLPAHDIGIRTFLVETPLSIKAIRKSVTDERLDACGAYTDLIQWLSAEKQGGL